MTKKILVILLLLLTNFEIFCASVSLEPMVDEKGKLSGSKRKNPDSGFEDEQDAPKSAALDDSQILKIGILQPKVIQQSEATCGYHALKNGILIARALLNGTNPAEELMDKSYVDKLFGDINASWRAFCIKRKLILNGAIPHIKLILTSSVNNKVIENLHAQSAITQIIDSVGIELSAYHKIENEIFFVVPKDIILKTLLDHANEKFRTSGAEIYAQIATAENLNLIFDQLQEIKFYIKSGKIFDCTSRILYKQIPDADGNWITGDSLDQLVKFEKSRADSSFAGHNIPVYVVENGTTSETHGQLDSYNALIKSFSDINTQQSAIFIINKSLGNSRITHWVTCVVHKVAGKKPQYILADSLGRDLSSDKTVLDFIKSIEKNNVICSNGIKQNEKFNELKNELNILLKKVSVESLKIDQEILGKAQKILKESDQNIFLTDFRNTNIDYSNSCASLIDLKLQINKILSEVKQTNKSKIKLLKLRLEEQKILISSICERKAELEIEINNITKLSKEKELAQILKKILDGIESSIDAFSNWQEDLSLTLVKSISESCNLDSKILSKLETQLGNNIYKFEVISNLKSFKRTMQENYQKYLPQIEKSQESILAKQKELSEIEINLINLIAQKSVIEKELELYNSMGLESLSFD